MAVSGITFAAAWESPRSSTATECFVRASTVRTALNGLVKHVKRTRTLDPDIEAVRFLEALETP